MKQRKSRQQRARRKAVTEVKHRRGGRRAVMEEPETLPLFDEATMGRAAPGAASLDAAAGGARKGTKNPGTVRRESEPEREPA